MDDNASKDEPIYGQFSTIPCIDGCCSLTLFPKEKKEFDGAFYPFEKRKAGVLVCCGDTSSKSDPETRGKVLIVQSYNNFWGIPKGRVESYDDGPKVCAERELKEETGMEIELKESDLFRIILDNCYVYKINVDSMDVVNHENLPILESTGIGWVKPYCALDFNINFLTRKVVMGIIFA